MHCGSVPAASVRVCCDLVAAGFRFGCRLKHAWGCITAACGLRAGARQGAIVRVSGRATIGAFVTYWRAAVVHLCSPELEVDWESFSYMLAEAPI